MLVTVSLWDVMKILIVTLVLIVFFSAVALDSLSQWWRETWKKPSKRNGDNK